MEVQNCLRGDGEEIRIFLHLIKNIVVKGWLDDTESNAESDRGVEGLAQGG